MALSALGILALTSAAAMPPEAEQTTVSQPGPGPAPPALTTNRQQRRAAARAQRKAQRDAPKSLPKLSKRKRFEQTLAGILQPVAFYTLELPAERLDVPSPTLARLTLFVEPVGFCAIEVRPPSLDDHPRWFARVVLDELHRAHPQTR